MKAMLIILFLLYPFEAFQLFAIGGYGVKAIDFALLAFYLLFLKEFIWDGKRFEVSYSQYITLLIFFLLVILLSSLYPLFSGDRYAIIQYFKTTAHFLHIFLFAFIALIYPYKPKDWIKVINIMLVFALFINVFGIYQIFARAFDLPFAWLEINNVSLTGRGALEVEDLQQLSLQFMDFFRATSIFSEPSFLAAFNTKMLLFQIVPFIRRKEQFVKTRWLSITIFSSNIIGTLATFSLTALLVIAGIVASLFLFENRKYLKHTIVAFVATAIIILIADNAIEKYTGASVVSLFAERVEGIFRGGLDQNKHITGESFSYRGQIIQTSIDIWLVSPIIGVGLGNFHLHQDVDIFFAQDIFFGTLSELGVIGNVIFLSFFASIYFAIFKFRINPDKFIIDDETNSLFSICLYIMIQMTLVNFFTTNYMIYPTLWFYIGLILFILNKIRLDNNINKRNVYFIKKPLKQYFKEGISYNSKELR